VLPHKPAASCSQKLLLLAGVPAHDVSGAEILDYAHEVIGKRQKALILNVNIHAAVLAMKQPWFKTFLRSAQMVFCDGDGFRWGLKLLGEKAPPKVPFTRWIWDLADFAAQKEHTLYFLGAKPGVAQTAAEAMKRKFPKLRIAGVQHGYFKKDGAENEEVMAAINQARPDFLIIGFGMPFQEEWLAKNWEKIDARIFLPAGAVFDYVSGALGEAPAWILRAHLEWLFRVWEEPKRLFGRYASEIPYFFIRAFWERIKRLFGADSE
jgi:N-acetylglucosaminyldiphosphoundecaprenol N-acetyl-beta-D-mannosaminyltransferase